MNADDLPEGELSRKAFSYLIDLPDTEAADVIGCWAAETGYNLRKIAVDVDDERFTAR